MKRYVIIAGVNGAGKSTLYLTSPSLKNLERINTDEILRERRYYESFRNVKKIIKTCDLIAFYDNTEAFRRFAIYKNGTPVRISKIVPSWFETYISNN